MTRPPPLASRKWIPNIQSPGMISPDEAAFFEESAAACVGRRGAIVDLGCWLGATSIALARGILSRGGTGEQEKVFAFDLFTWERWMPASVSYCLYEPGDSFLPEARRLTHEHGGGKVELIQTDLTCYQWSGGPIKILLVDAMKSEALARQIARSFYPSLEIGSLLIHQDFKHFHTSWIHLLHYQLREHFQFHRSVPESGTLAFELVNPISPNVVEPATEFSRLSDDQIDTSFRHSIELLRADDCANVAAAHVMQYVHLGQKARAGETLETYRRLGISDKGEFPKVLNSLEQMGPNPVPRPLRS